MTETTMNDLLVRIATDPDLVREIQADPGLLTTRFGLSPDEAARVAAMRIDSRSAPPRQLEERFSRSGGAFGSIVAAAAQTAEHDSGGESVDYGVEEEPQQLVSSEAPGSDYAEPESSGTQSPEPSTASEPEPDEEMAAPSPSPGVQAELDEPEPDETEPDEPEMAAPSPSPDPPEMNPETEPEMASPSPAPPPVDAEAIHARVDQALTGALEGRGIELPPEIQTNLSRAITDVLVGLQSAEPEPAGEAEPGPAPEPAPAGETPDEPEVDPARTTTAVEKDADGNEVRMTTTYDADGNLLDVTSVKTQTTVGADGTEVRVETTTDRTGGTQVHHHADGSTDTYHLSRDGIITHLGSTEPAPEPEMAAPSPSPGAEPGPGPDTEPQPDDTRTTTEFRKDADGNEIRITTTSDADGYPVETRSQTVLDADGNEITVETTRSTGGFTQVQHNVDGSKDIYEVSKDGLITHTTEPAPHAPGSVEPAEHVPGTPLPKETSGIGAR